MEHINLTHSGHDVEPQHIVSLPLLSVPEHPLPPTLRDGELYHVFISYSSTDWHWTHSLIDQLESRGLQVCYHERDFIPGRTVLENMSDCIQESQKVLLVLSPEFVRSRWCLLEANMSLFRDCLERKPIVPVLLEPGVSVPLHLCHLTYLEARDADFFSKALRVLCTPNQQLRGSTVVPFQLPSIYNGKALQPLIAVNEEGLLNWDAGLFSDMDVPDQLRLVIEDPETYRVAVRVVNSVYENKVWPRSLWPRLLICVGGQLFVLALAFLNLLLFAASYHTLNEHAFLVFIFLIVPLGVVVHLVLLVRDGGLYVIREMRKAVGQANTLLSQHKVLMGCLTNAKLYLVYVSLDGCRREFANTFPEQGCAEEQFQRALVFFSSGYTCRLAKRHFHFPQPSSPGHLEGGVCFCQYVSYQLSRGEWE